MNAYDRFASVYDRIGADRFSRDMVAYTFRIARRFGVRAQTGLDLCCGTGTAMELLADRGLSVAGLDRSSAMLSQARRKLMGKGVKLYRQSLPRFRIPDGTGGGRVRKFDLVTCFYDSLNYLKNERELKAAFRSVYRHLAPGGWFVFDMNTPVGLKLIWDSQIWGGVRNDVAWIWRNAYHARTQSAECATTFFVKAGRNWRRFDELHLERAYSNRVVRRLLRETGLTVIAYYRCFTFDKPSRETCRICAVARRNR
ncbi:MAG TPA: class I SAM-dependent methyltransferase [Acidobacteriota bacterium]|nr:class I SAM-dependent methyltransferase [Acidobacteriota bacterium]